MNKFRAACAASLDNTATCSTSTVGNGSQIMYLSVMFFPQYWWRKATVMKYDKINEDKLQSFGDVCKSRSIYYTILIGGCREQEKAGPFASF